MPDTTTPGADLAPIDQACAQRTQSPDRSGSFAGHGWAAWWHYVDDRRNGWWKYVIYKPNGEYLKDYVWRGRTRHPRKYHSMHPVDGCDLDELVEAQILRHILREADYSHVLDTMITHVQAGDVGDVLREQRARERRHRTRAAAARFYGKSYEHVSKADLDAYRRRGGERARGSFSR